ncbi:MAG: serine hydrolase [Vicinamibacterales bacterium]
MRSRVLSVGSMVCTLLFAAPAVSGGQPLPPEVKAVVDGFKGQLYFAAKNLETGQTIGYRADDKVQTASVIKLPILVEVFAQAKANKIALEDVVALTDSNRVSGSGVLQNLGLGLHMTVRDAAVLMIILSDNTATNILIDKVGIKPVNDRMRSLGLTETTLYKKVSKPATDPLTEEQKKWGLGVTTAGEMMALLEKIYRKEVVDAASCDEMIAIMKQQKDRDQMPRLLVGPGWEKVEIANKTGALSQVRNDVGIVFTPDGDYILSLFAQDSQDRKWTADNEATVALGKLSLALLNHLRARTPTR